MRKASSSRWQGISQVLALGELFSFARRFEAASYALTWTRFSGALLVVLLVLLLLSGSLMAFYYSPYPGAAYDSVDYAQFSVPFGDIVRGIHHYAWNLLLIVMGLHLVRTFLAGAHKAPRQLTWISGVLFLMVVPLAVITGDLLPWNQKGYWTTQVRMSIIASVPIAGDFLGRLLQGGPRTGVVALTRFYVLHLLFVPGLLFGLVVLHFGYIRHWGLAERLSGAGNRRRLPLFPTLMNRWLVLFLLTTLVLGFLAWQRPAALGDPADPTDTSFVPRPEWWVLFLNQLVSIFKGPLAILGTVVVPGGLFLLLLCAPFLERTDERHPLRRKKAMLIAMLAASIISLLSVAGYLEHF